MVARGVNRARQRSSSATVLDQRALSSNSPPNGASIINWEMRNEGRASQESSAEAGLAYSCTPPEHGAQARHHPDMRRTTMTSRAPSTHSLQHPRIDHPASRRGLGRVLSREGWGLQAFIERKPGEKAGVSKRPLKHERRQEIQGRASG